MRFILLLGLLACLVAVAVGGPVAERMPDHDNPLQPICFRAQLQQEAHQGSQGATDMWRGLRGGACYRYVTGFDITGVLTEVDLTFHDGVRTACDCAFQCFKRDKTCTNWVWKFTPADSQHRTCTLYSNFNLPSDVTIGYNLTASKNFQLLQSANNPQQGSQVPHCTKSNGQGNDPKCVSGMMFRQDDGKSVC